MARSLNRCFSYRLDAAFLNALDFVACACPNQDPEGIDSVMTLRIRTGVFLDMAIHCAVMSFFARRRGRAEMTTPLRVMAVVPVRVYIRSLLGILGCIYLIPGAGDA
ncbi:hypothetical protein IF2G_06231 [Cordyceps javanica]|nr:hypothetical protein IF2G_06231 [Cordyceps javanica]